MNSHIAPEIIVHEMGRILSPEVILSSYAVASAPSALVMNAGGLFMR